MSECKKTEFVVKVASRGSFLFLEGIRSAIDRSGHRRKVVSEAVLTSDPAKAKRFDSEFQAGYAAESIDGAMACPA